MSKTTNGFSPEGVSAVLLMLGLGGLHPSRWAVGHLDQRLAA
jgi:hypothetical protein